MKWLVCIFYSLCVSFETSITIKKKREILNNSNFVFHFNSSVFRLFKILE